MLFKAYIALNEHKLIIQRYKKNMYTFIENIILLISTERKSTFTKEQQEHFLDIFGHALQDPKKRDVLDFKVLFYSLQSRNQEN